MAVDRPAYAVTITAASPSPSPTGGNESDVMAVVALYEEAFTEADCDLFMKATTQSFRDSIGVSDCATFVERANGRAEVVDSLILTPVSAGGTGRGTMAALVQVEMQSFLDENGQVVEEAVQSDHEYRYHFVRSGGDWRITRVNDVTGGRTEGRLTADEEVAAAATMEKWSVAYSTGDCDALQASTTAGFQSAMGIPDCATFAQSISDQNAYCPMTVHQEDIRFWDRVDTHSGEILIDVVEVCTLDLDESGNPIDPPYQSGSPYRYHMVESDGTWKIAEGDDGAAREDEPANANERAAIAAMREYNQAWLDGDCDVYMSTTDEQMRSAIGLETCDSFTSAAQSFSQSIANFTLTPTDIERPSATLMEIKSRETYDSLSDADGQPVDPPYPVEDYWVYTIVLDGSSWVITDIVKLL
jgi:hypothetical protein